MIFKTLRKHQRLAIWKDDGTVRYLDGPLFVWTLFRKVQMMQAAVAGREEYLVIRTRDGRLEHRRGPHSLWRDPVEHELVAVEPLVEIKPDTAVVVCREEADGRVTRRPLHGPCLFMPEPNQWLEQLEHHTAAIGEYLVVRGHDGRVEHRRGPCEAWFDRGVHERIETRPALHVDANEAVVVYRETEGAVARRILHGPAQFVPEPGEWLHEFSWHGAEGEGGRKRPHALRFTRLWTVPDQMYADVEHVRTADDALLEVGVMMFFELVDIDRMLDTTHDPVADFLNALTADILEFAAPLSFEAFKEGAEALSDLGTYAHLVQRAGRIGYQVSKVVYRGYTASDELQAMHDHAIESRTALRLEAETEEQAQTLADLKLERDVIRAEKQQEMDRQAAEHGLELERLQHAEALRRNQVDLEHEIEAARRRHTVEEGHEERRNQVQAHFLGGLHDMQVDLSRYLVAQYQHPDRLIRIEGHGGNGVHLHAGEGA